MPDTATTGNTGNTASAASSSAGTKGTADCTQITVILDRTGSMESIRADTIGGFNSFLAEHKRLPTQVTLTLVQFDSQDP